MQIILYNRRKVTTNSSRSVFKKNNKVEEGGASCLGVKREHESIDLMARKMMRGKIEPFVVPIVVRALPTMIQVIIQTTTIPQMTSPQKTTKGAKAGSTTNDIAIGEITKGIEVGN